MHPFTGYFAFITFALRRVGLKVCDLWHFEFCLGLNAVTNQLFGTSYRPRSSVLSIPIIISDINWKVNEQPTQSKCLKVPPSLIFGVNRAALYGMGGKPDIFNTRCFVYDLPPLYTQEAQRNPQSLVVLRIGRGGGVRREI